MLHGGRDRDHVAVNKVPNASLIHRNGILVLQRPDVIGAHPTILPGNRVAFQPGFVVAAHQAVDVKLHIKGPLLLIGEESAVHSLLDTNEPGADGVDSEVNALVLNIGEGRVFQIPHEMRRHPEDPANLIYLKFARFQKLCFIVRNGNRLEFHAFFQNGHTVGIGGAAVGAVPAVPDSLGILHRVRVSQDTRRAGTIGEELAVYSSDAMRRPMAFFSSAMRL